MRTHRPAFPPYPLPPDPEKKTLAWIEQKKVIDQYGTIYHFDDVDELHHLAFRHDLQLFTSSITSEEFQPLLDSMVHAPKYAKVCCTKLGIPFLVRFSDGKRSTWITTSETWQVPPGYESLARLNMLFEYFGLGTTHTPASLGTRSMMHVYELNGYHRHPSPSAGVEHYLRAHCVGGIVQAPGKGRFYEEAVQLDMASAYLSRYEKHPDGSASYFAGGEPGNAVTYFAECTIRIPRPLPLGVFPVREDNRYTVRYPTEPGTYSAYLWKEQVEDARLAGCEVDVREGFAWRRWTSHNYPWSQYAYFKRKQAPEEIEQDVKRVINGGMGKFGVNRQQWYLVPAEHRRPGDRGTSDNHIPLSFFIREERNDRLPLMLHWYFYTIMQTNRVVYLFALPFAQQGKLVWMDYDSVMVLDDSVKGLYLKKYDPRTLFIQPGTWLWSLWRSVTIAHHGERSFKGIHAETGAFIDHSPGRPAAEKDHA